MMTEVRVREAEVEAEDDLRASDPVLNPRGVTPKLEPLPANRPEWLPDSAQIRCFTCQCVFGVLIWKHHCRLCGFIFCDECTRLRASFPARYGYKGPQRICTSCAPRFFKVRGLSVASNESMNVKTSMSEEIRDNRRIESLSDLNDLHVPMPEGIQDEERGSRIESSVERLSSPERRRRMPGERRAKVKQSITNAVETAVHPRTALRDSGLGKARQSEVLAQMQADVNVTEEGFFTHSDNALSVPLRVLDPICKIAFWWSGMYKGGAFNRSTLQLAANFGVPIFTVEKVGSVADATVTIPMHWPSYEDEEAWSKLKELWPLDCTKPPKSKVLKKSMETFPMKVIIFTPIKGSGPFPVLLWFHGGGFCLGSVENQIYQMICRSLANRSGCIVVSVEYRLAPDFKFPTQVEDAYAALQWVYRKAGKLDIDRTRIAVGGDSAGGSLSALLTILTKERHGPEICHQLLVYPCLTSPLTDDLPSHVQYKEGPVLSRDVVNWFMDQLFDDKEKWLNHPLAMPLIYEDLSNLPPATIINAQHDPLRDHGKIYQERLRAAGVEVSRSVYTKSLHGFFGTSLGESNEALMECSYALRHAFHS